MPKLGIVLSGCASKGAYEIGAMQAIVDYFGMESIQCVSSASIGAIVGHGIGMDRVPELEMAFRDMDNGKYGRYILSFPSNKQAVADLEEMFRGDNKMFYKHHVAMWNCTDSRVEYMPFHELSSQELTTYLRAAISFPLFTRGVQINGKRYMDGALLDNIPVYPLVDQELDYIICIYFDNQQYVFESETFDRKVIKLHNFPNQDRLEVLFCNPGSYERMYDYAYRYADQLLRELFADPDPEAVYRAIAVQNRKEPTYKRRLTADVVLSGINTMTKRYSKAPSTREKVKKT